MGSRPQEKQRLCRVNHRLRVSPPAAADHLREGAQVLGVTTTSPPTPLPTTHPASTTCPVTRRCPACLHLLLSLPPLSALISSSLRHRLFLLMAFQLGSQAVSVEAEVTIGEEIKSRVLRAKLLIDCGQCPGHQTSSLLLDLAWPESRTRTLTAIDQKL